jgi:hypothetical protein
MNDYNDEIDGRIRTQLGLSQLNSSIGYLYMYEDRFLELMVLIDKIK